MRKQLAIAVMAIVAAAVLASFAPRDAATGPLVSISPSELTVAARDLPTAGHTDAH